MRPRSEDDRRWYAHARAMLERCAVRRGNGYVDERGFGPRPERDGAGRHHNERGATK